MNLLLGHAHIPTANSLGIPGDCKEPYESRGSRTVLWEARGEIPLVYSTFCQEKRTETLIYGLSKKTTIYLDFNGIAILHWRSVACGGRFFHVELRRVGLKWICYKLCGPRDSSTNSRGCVRRLRTLICSRLKAQSSRHTVEKWAVALPNHHEKPWTLNW